MTTENTPCADFPMTTDVDVSTTNEGKRIIIEGPDCVGKDTFIAGLQDFINGVDRFGGRNMTAYNEEYVVHKASGERFPIDAEPGRALVALIGAHEYMGLSDQERALHDDGEPMDPFTPEERAKAAETYAEYERLSVPMLKPMYADSISHRSIHTKDGSRESAEFIRKLDGGEITDQLEIANEYLQAHYDLENLAAELQDVLTLVIMNRSLISFHAMQIHALGLEHCYEKWQKLWNYSDQPNALFVRLTAPEAVVRERLAKRQGSDFRGEVEDFYMAKWQQIEHGFIDFQNSKRCPATITVNTTEADMVPYYQQICQWVLMGQIHDSLERGEGTATCVAGDAND